MNGFPEQLYIDQLVHQRRDSNIGSRGRGTMHLETLTSVSQEHPHSTTHTVSLGSSAVTSTDMSELKPTGINSISSIYYYL